jgi:hypothetical protein
MEAHMIIVDTPHGAAVLDWRGYHKMDPEKLYRRLYGSFAKQLEKPPEGDNAESPGEDNTHKEADNGGTGRG